MCIRIDTDVLLANLVYAKYIYGQWPIIVTFEELKTYLNFLSSMSSIYILSNLSIYKFRACADEFPNLYNLVDDNEMVMKIDGIPNLEYFNSLYSKDFKEYLQNISKVYLIH